MTQILFANNALTTLAAPISNSSTTCVVASGTGSLFPSPSAGQIFKLTFSPAAGGGASEIVNVTNVSGDTLTIVRGQEGTIAQAWNALDSAQALITAGSLANFAQGGLAPNFALDTGSANIMVANLPIAPASLAALVGVPIQIQKSNAANTSATVTLALNTLAAVNITHADGTALGANGELPANGILTVVLNEAETEYQLQSVASQPALMSEFTSSNTSAGWMKRPDGLIEQWGIGTTTGGSGNVVFPIAFPTAAFIYSANVGTVGNAPQSAADHYSACDPSSVTTTGMNIYSAAGSSITMTYRVIGH